MNHAKEKKAQRIATLIAGYLRETLTPTEHDELDEWVGASDKNMHLFEELTDENKIQKAFHLFDDKEDLLIVKKLNRSQVTRPSFAKRLLPYGIAASLLLVSGTIAFLLNKKSPASSTASVASVHQEDVKPGGKKAILTLIDGSAIALEQQKNGELVLQGQSAITKLDGQLKYTNTQTASVHASPYNSLTTARGGTYQLTLPDGTNLWLNASSSVRFPVAFTGEERKVTITGEVYFEVAKNKKPFLVELKDKNMTVEVLGTHFNINSYSDEPLIKTTLLEGSVRLVMDGQTTMLKPGDQAQLNRNNKIELVKADTLRAVSWKYGDFDFYKENVSSIMRQLSRWYDVDIEYDGNMPVRALTGRMSRDSTISVVLGMFSESAVRDFRVEGKKVIITPL